jgi:hypothetical protein
MDIADPIRRIIMTYNEMITELKNIITGWIEMETPPRGYIGVSYTQKHGFVGVVANQRNVNFTLDKTFTIDGRKKGETTDVKIGLMRLDYVDVKYWYFKEIPGVMSYTCYHDLYRASRPESALPTTGFGWYNLDVDGTAVVSIPEVVEDGGELILMDGHPRKYRVKTVEHVVKVLDAVDCSVGGKDRSKVISWAATLQPGASCFERAGYLVINNTGSPVVVQNQTYVEDWGDSRHGGHFE